MADHVHTENLCKPHVGWLQAPLEGSWRERTEERQTPRQNASDLRDDITVDFWIVCDEVEEWEERLTGAYVGPVPKNRM